MAATRLIALHAGKGKSLARTLNDRTDYAKNPEKTEKGNLVTAYGCDPITVDEEFMLQKRLYYQITGRTRRDDVIAYQIRQSFKPGEITPEEANRLGYELAMRFTKGMYSFIVATHTDRAHIHNHVVFNSTAMDGTRKFRNFHRSGIALQKISDLICLENGLSVITPAPYGERKKRTDYPKRETFRHVIRADIDGILLKRPGSYQEFLRFLEEAGYEIKTGKHLAVRGENQKHFIRLSSLGFGYTEEDILARIAGEDSKGDASERHVRSERPLNLLIDIQAKLQGKGVGYAKWATIYNLKQMSKTLLFLRERGIDSLQQLQILAAEKAGKRDEILADVRLKEERLKEIVALRKHILGYSRTRRIYEDYRKAGYSKAYYEAHREELTIHKAAKSAFDECGLKTIPSLKELNAEYAGLMVEKKQVYAEYRQIKEEAQELAIAVRNVEALFEAEKKEMEKEHVRERTH